MSYLWFKDEEDRMMVTILRQTVNILLGSNSARPDPLIKVYYYSFC
jgi:hypothetical protein